MEYDRICPVCGEHFTGRNARAVYCSAKCKQQALRDRERAEADRKAAIDASREKLKSKRQERARAKKCQAEREQAAAAGDPFARMQLNYNKKSVEYWEAFQDYEISYSGKGSGETVNGIDIDRDDFAEAVLLTIEETGLIMTYRPTGKEKEGGEHEES